MRRKYLNTVMVIAIIAFMAATCTGCELTDKIKYAHAMSCLEDAEYQEARKQFEALGDYRESEVYSAEAIFRLAGQYVTEERYGEAKELYEEIAEYEAAANMIGECAYLQGKKAIAEGNLEEAVSALEQLSNYKDSDELLIETRYQLYVSQLEKGDFDNALKNMKELEGYKDTEELFKKARYDHAVSYFEAEQYIEAYDIFSDMGDYEESSDYCKKIVKNAAKELYNKAKTLYEDNDMESALKLFEGTGKYKKSKEYVKKIQAYLNLQGTWIFQDKYMKKIGSRYNMKFDEWNLTVTIVQGNSAGNKDSTYEYSCTLTKYKGKWCMKYGENTYCMYIPKKDKMYVYRHGKLENRYKRDSQDAVSG